MKISFVTFTCPTWSLDQAIDAAVRLGYQGIEFRCDARHGHGVEIYTDKIERADIRRKLDRYELEVPCLGTSLRLVDEAVVEQANARIELAAQIGAPGLRLFCGPHPEGMETQILYEMIAERLRAIAQNAEESGVGIWLETHDTLMKAAQSAAVVKLADRSNLGIVYDNMHPYRAGETLADTFREMNGLMKHVHFHDAINDRDKVVITPFGKGQLPYEQMLDALVSSGYDGYLSAEWFGEMYGPDPEEALLLYKREVSDMLEKRGLRVGAKWG